MADAVCKICRRRAFAAIHPFIHPAVSFPRQTPGSRRVVHRIRHGRRHRIIFSQIGRPHIEIIGHKMYRPQDTAQKETVRCISHYIWHPVVILPIVKTTIARHLQDHATLLPPDACDAPITHSMLPPDDPSSGHQQQRIFVSSQNNSQLPASAPTIGWDRPPGRPAGGGRRPSSSPSWLALYYEYERASIACEGRTIHIQVLGKITLQL